MPAQLAAHPQPAGHGDRPKGMRSRLAPVAALLTLAGCGSASAPAAHVSATSPRAAATPGAPSSHASSTCRHGAGVSARDVFGGYGRDALTGVQFVSASQGWVVGQRVILATSDGGATWSAQDRGSLNLTSVDFVSRDAGWAVGLDALLATTDGGRHWAALREPCLPIRSVHFVSARTGFAVAGGSNLSGDGSLAPQSGGVVLRTANGGITWQRLRAPANAQSVCFSGSDSGWLGAAGRLYSSMNGGRSWQLRAAGPIGKGAPSAPGVMFAQCAEGGSAWGLDIGPGAAMSQEPHIGYHASPAGAVPIFAEQFFPHPGVAAPVSSPGSYAGPMSAISSSAAVFIDWCPACGYGTVPWDLATANGAMLTREGNVGGINQAFGASFLDSSAGWVVGSVRSGGSSAPRIVRTDDGGRTWQVQYAP